jgi:general secretion pathway protein D
LARAFTIVLIAATLTACESWVRQEADRGIVQSEPSQVQTVEWPQQGRPVTAALDPPDDQRADQVARVIDRGTGTFVTAPPERTQAAITTDATRGITLNALDADLREIVRMVFAEALHVNYLIDPAVHGRITIQTSRPVPSDDLLPILDAVLRMNGAALVQSGDLYKVVPIEQAATTGLLPDVEPVPGAGRPGFGVQIVPLRYVSATEIARLLAPFASPPEAIQIDTARNLLLLTGSAEQLATLKDLLAIFDVNWLQGMSFGLFPLETALPEQLAKELEQIFGGTESGPLAGLLRFVPIERLNAILAISSQPFYLDQADIWIKRLDREAEGEQPRTYVYAVQNGRAADLADVLSAIFNARRITVGPPSLLRPGLEPIELRSTPPTDGAPTGTHPSPDNSSPGSNEARIIADETTNSLVIHATPRDYRDIRDALNKLDIRRLQVLIEATIAEVTLRNELRFGIDWFLRSGDFRLSFSSAASGAVQSQFPGFSALLTGTDVMAVLNALEEITDINVISSPQIVVLDNQKAELQVGDQVPIITQQAQSLEGADSPILQTIEQVPTGVLLTVIPRVNSSGLVTMEIQQEVSNAIETVTSDINSPTISQRKITSTVAIESGETVALGGLIRDNSDHRQTGIPFLARLPVVGPLFGVTDNGSERTELLVLITPKVIGSQKEARLVTEELRRRIRAVAPLSGRI